MDTRHARPKQAVAAYLGMGTLIGFGAALGLVLGTLLGNLVLGLSAGVAIGTVAGAILEGLRQP